MPSPAHTAVLTLHAIFFVAGLMGNMFILAVNFMVWMKNSSDLNSCDLILSSLGVSNLGHLCVFFAINMCYIFWQAFSSLDHVTKTFNFAMMCLRCSSIWFSTWFCVYCCVMIVNFTHPFLAQLVTKFLANVPWLLLGSVLVSLVTCLPLAFTSQIQPAASVLSNISIGTRSNASVNASITGSQVQEGFNKGYTVYIVIFSLVFAIFFFSAVAIFTTLCRHMKRMEQNADSFRNPCLDAHLGAVKTLTSLLILYSSLHLSNCIIYFGVAPPESLLYFTCILATASSPALNSIILILGISKLKTTMARIFSLAGCCRQEGA